MSDTLIEQFKSLDILENKNSDKQIEYYFNENCNINKENKDNNKIENPKHKGKTKKLKEKKRNKELEVSINKDKAKDNFNQNIKFDGNLNPISKTAPQTRRELLKPCLKSKQTENLNIIKPIKSVSFRDQMPNNNITNNSNNNFPLATIINVPSFKKHDIYMKDNDYEYRKSKKQTNNCFIF
jgi:hypothetical protein